MIPVWYLSGIYLVLVWSHPGTCLVLTSGDGGESNLYAILVHAYCLVLGWYLSLTFLVLVCYLSRTGLGFWILNHIQTHTVPPRAKRVNWSQL